MISIIVPAYNCSRWLEETVASVISQTYENWEMLIIDDCSSDDTGQISKRLAASDDRIRCISTDYHSGPAAVRNIGLGEARGNYIAFIDGDDLWPKYSLEYLLKGLEESGAFILCGNLVRVSDNRSQRLLSKLNRYYKTGKLNKLKKYKTISPEEGMEATLYQRGVEGSLGGKLYKREIFEGLAFKEGELYEDLNLFYRILLNCRNIAVSQMPVYLYRQRKGSVVHTFISDRLVVLEVTKRIEDYMRLNYPHILAAASDRRFSANFDMLHQMLRHPEIIDYPRKEKIEEVYTYLKSHARTELSDKKVRLKNRIGAMCVAYIPKFVLYGILKIKNKK